jgi:hypothetical protein
MTHGKRWTAEQEVLIESVLVGLLKKAGGQITLTEDELGEGDESMVLTVEEAAGIVVIDLIPDFVKTEEPKEVNPWDKMTFTPLTTTVTGTGTVTSVPLTFTTGITSGTITYKMDLT